MPHPTFRRLALTALAAAIALGSATTQARVQTMIVTSDPQYPWTDVTDRGGNESDDDRNRRSEALIREQYESINRYRAAHADEDIPVVINGDLTAYGHGWQRDKMKELLQILGDNVYLGLGNHDYENNIRKPNGEGCYNNGCARDSIVDLSHNVNDRADEHRIFAFDWASQTNTFNITHSGSLAYAFVPKGFDEGPLQLQLNNYPEYEVSFTSGLVKDEYRIRPSVEWARTTLLTHIWRKDQFAIVHMHQPEWSGEFARIASDNQVLAVFAGHFHRELGKQPYRLGDIPVYLSGSASQRTYLIVEKDDELAEMRIYAVRENHPENKQLIDTLTIPARR